MTRIPLLSPILDHGIRDTNFFNGRLLTAQDLQTFQAAVRDHHRLLGRAMGDGVAAGLNVTLVIDGTGGVAPVVNISAGLAVNRRGRVLALPEAVQVVLAKSAAAPPPDLAAFDDCGEVGGTATISGTLTGASVLVVTPASGLQGRVPLRSLDACGCETDCGSKYAVEGVKFRLVPLAPPASFLDAPLKLRNGLAHWCFGTADLLAAAANPFQTPEQYGAIDALRAAGELTDCDVPLALIYWTPPGVQFVDEWAVRRFVVARPSGGGDNPWPAFVNPRRAAEARAMFLQFQRELADLVGTEKNLAGIAAIDRFYYLPPAGFVPEVTKATKGKDRRDLERQAKRLHFFLLDDPADAKGNFLSPFGPGRGFVAKKFFDTFPTEDAELDLAFARSYVDKSWAVEPIDTAAPPPVRLYRAANFDKLSGVGEPPWLLFVRQEKKPSPPKGPARIAATLVFPWREWRAAGGPELLAAGVDVVASDEQQAGDPSYRYHARLDRYTEVLGKQTAAGTVEAVFLFDPLPPGTYAVSARAAGFETDPRPGVPLAAGETKELRFVMKREVTNAPEPVPGRGAGGKKYKFKDAAIRFGARADVPVGGRYTRVVAVPRYAGDPVKKPFGGDPVEEKLPPAWEDYARTVGDAVRDENPDLFVDPDDVKLVRDPTYTPETVATQPYAYFTYGGDGGAWVPVMLVPAEHATDAPVPVDKDNAAGLDAADARGLEDAGVARLDALSAGWTGVVEDALGVNPDTAAAVITEAREKVADVQGTVRMLSGVTEARERELKAAGVSGLPDLANADPASLEAVGSPAYVRRLIDEARAAVPAAQWKPGENVGLKEGETAALEKAGIRSVGDLKRATDANNPAGRAAVRTALNTADDAVAALAGSAGRVAIETGDDFRATRLGAAPAVTLLGVTTDANDKLAGAGVRSVADLSKAAPADVARAVGADEARGRELVNAARLKIGLRGIQ